MTLHQITLASNSIIKRKKMEMRFQAACLGATFKDDTDVKEVELNEKQLLAIEKADRENRQRRKS